MRRKNHRVYVGGSTGLAFALPLLLIATPKQALTFQGGELGTQMESGRLEQIEAAALYAADDSRGSQ